MELNTYCKGELTTRNHMNMEANKMVVVERAGISREHACFEEHRGTCSGFCKQFVHACEQAGRLGTESPKKRKEPRIMKRQRMQEHNKRNHSLVTGCPWGFRLMLLLCALRFVFKQCTS